MQMPPRPWGWLCVALFLIDVVLAFILGKQFLQDRPGLLSYLSSFFGFLSLLVALFSTFIDAGRALTPQALLDSMGTSLRAQLGFIIATFFLLVSVFFAHGLVDSILNPRAESLGPQSTVAPLPWSEGPYAATVNGYVISQAYLSKTMDLNSVLGELSGASTLDREETLQRLIRSHLVLQGAPAIEEPTQEQVERSIASLEESWGVSDEEVNQELEAAGVDRAFLEQTINRLLMVEAGVDSLENEGHDISDWLQEEEERADIKLQKGLDSAEVLKPKPAPDPDDYEPDDAQHQAGGITANGPAQRHSFHTVFEEDWVRFSALVGREYTIRTFDLEFGCHTVLRLFDASGVPVVMNDNWTAEPPGSRIDWTAEESGVHYISVSQGDPWVAGNLEYSLEVTETGHSQ
jgi:hypothetical protein